MIIAPDQLPILRERVGRGLVLVAGVFDPLHAGHLAYFDKARAFGPLVCAVASDAYIRRVKGRPPLLPQAARMALLDRLCDYVIAQDETGEAGALEELRPETYAKGMDWLDKLPEAEATACHAFGIPAVFLEGATVDSSTARLTAYQRALDAMKVEQFEAFVARQRPATKAWTPVTDYSFEARKAIEGPHPQLIKDVFQLVPPMEVLDVGCGPGHLVTLLRQLGVDATGVDIQHPDPTYRFDVTTDPEEAGWSAHLIVCRELLEHLTVVEVVQAVRNLVRMAGKYIYVTCRVNRTPSHLLDVQDHDDLDPDHRTLLNPDLLRLLFVLEGCTRRADLEARLDWNHQGRVFVYQVP